MSSIETTARIDSLQRAVAGKPEDMRTAMVAGYELSSDGQQLRVTLLGELAAALSKLPNHDHFREPSTLAKVAKTKEVAERKKRPERVEAIEQDKQVLEWAENIRSQFCDLPESQPKKSNKKSQQRDRNFLINTFGEVGLSESEPRHVLYRPDVVARMFESWLVAADEDETGRTDELLDSAADYLSGKISKDWEKVPKETLAGYVKELAHDSLAKDYLEELFASYFEGPNTREERLISYINLNLAAQFVLQDQAAIDYLTRVSSFRTSVLPRGELIKDIHTYGNCLKVKDYSLRKDAELLHNGLSAISTLGAKETDYIKPSPDEIESYQYNYISSSLLYLKEEGYAKKEALKHLEERYGLIERYQDGEFSELTAVEFQAQVRQEYGDETAEWFVAAQFIASDYRKEYLGTFGHRANALIQAEVFAEESGIYKDCRAQDVVSGLLDNGVVDIYLPLNLRLSHQDYKLILDEAIKVYDHKVDEITERVANTGLKVVEELVYDGERVVDVDFKGQVLHIGLRNRCLLDVLHEHDLNRLMWKDVPNIEGEDFISSQEISQRIKDNYRWLVGPRTFEVEFKSDEMRVAGFEKITFCRPEGEKAVHVALVHQGRPIEYKINEHWQLDLEGRGIHSERLKDIIERRTLAVLEAYSTKEVLETNKGTISEKGSTPGIGFVPAMLVWVGGLKKDGEPKSFSDEQRQIYLEKEGKDLAVESAKRQQREDAEGRHSTYRKYYGLPDGPAIELYVDDPRII